MQQVEFMPSTYYCWEQQEDESCPKCAIEKCKHIIIGYALKEIPEFNELQDNFAEKNYHEALLRQKTLIDTVNNIFFNSTNNLTGYLELRLANDIEKKIVNCYLLLRLINTSISHEYNPYRLQEEFKSLIPDDYILTPLCTEEIKNILKLNNRSLIEIRKKSNLLSVGSFFQEESFGIAARNLVEWDTRTKYHIPCTSYIEPKTYNLSNLYKLLQNATEPVQIRISIGANRVFEFEKNIALEYHSMLKTTYGSIATPEINANINAFSKYIGSKELFSLKIQVAANNEVTAMSVGNAFCGQLSYGEIKAQTNLECFSLKKYGIEIKDQEQDWENCNHYFYDNKLNLLGFKDDIDETIKSFILRMPYLSDGSEAMAVFRLPIADAKGLPGMIAKSIKPFYQPNPKEQGKEIEIDLGKIITSSNTKSTLAYKLPISNLTKHGLIVGATGSGKTNTTLNFVKELVKNDIPFLLIEPVKSEYYDQIAPLLKEKGEILHRFQFKNPRLDNGQINPNFLRFNPFIPQKGVTTIQHLSYIKSCFMAAFPMYGIMPLILEDCLYEYFKKNIEGNESKYGKGLLENEFFNPSKSIPFWVEKSDKGNRSEFNNDYRTIKLFSSYISTYLKENDRLFDNKMKAELEGGLNRRFIKLTKGLLGQVFCPENWRNPDKLASNIPDNLDVILNKSCVIELESLPENEDKALMMAFILTFLFENRQMRPSHHPSNKLHVTIIEEAHRLLSNSSMKSSGSGEGASLSQDSGSKTISLFIDMLAEIRAKNEAIYIIEQSPTKLVADAIKNTNLKIMHRLTNKSDRDYLGEAMNMDEQQSRYATTLQQGEALVFEEQLDKPILVKMNNFKEK